MVSENNYGIDDQGFSIDENGRLVMNNESSKKKKKRKFKIYHKFGLVSILVMVVCELLKQSSFVNMVWQDLVILLESEDSMNNLFIQMIILFALVSM